MFKFLQIRIEVLKTDNYTYIEPPGKQKKKVKHNVTAN